MPLHAAFNHYDVDFGMGIPALVRPAHLSFPNSALIMPGYPGTDGYEISMILTAEVAAKTIQDQHWMSLVDRCDYDHWECGACKTEVDSGSVGWTYRIGVYLVSASPAWKTGGEGASTASSVLGSTADAWFGCTAAQWVEMVGRDVAMVARIAGGVGGLSSAIPAGAAEAESGMAETETFVASHLASSLAALVDGVSGVSGAYAGFSFKPAAPPWHHAKEATANRTVSRIAGLMSDDGLQASWFPTISVLWRFVVSESLCAIHRHHIASSSSTSNTNSSPVFAELERRVKGLRSGSAQIAWGLSTPPSMTAISFMAVALEEPDTRHAEPVGSMDPIDTMHSMLHCTWEDLHLPMAYDGSRPQQQRHHPASCKADTESDEMDELLDQCSQLLQSFNTAANLSACKHSGSAVAADNDNDNAVSVQLFEESIHDDQLFSLYAGCSQQLFLLSQPSLFGHDKAPGSPALFDTGKEMLFRPEGGLQQDGGTMDDEEESYQYSTPPGTFMRALEDTPETVARDIMKRNGKRQSGALHQDNEVLAPETPAAPATSTPKRPRNHGLDPGSTSPSSFWSPAGNHGPAIVPSTADRRGARLLQRRSNTDQTMPSRAPAPKRSLYNNSNIHYHKHRRLLTERASSMSGVVASARIPDPPPPLLRLSVRNNAPSHPPLPPPVVVLAPETPVARSWAPRPLDLVASGDERRVRREQNEKKNKNN
ncbi:hypothetical protein EV177_000013 [Coemansia sp. RSA 1804]|nr:hypothetical protein EV177_000013 [Coemansia sp. RSA 1804]